MRIIFVLLLLLPAWLFAQEEKLQAGPMVGYSEMLEVQLWVQTNQPAMVQIRYAPKHNPGESHLTRQVKTTKDKAFTAHLTADSVTPGTRYTYELFIDQVQVPRPYALEFSTLPLWRWRGDAPDFSFLTGSCAFINEQQYDRPGTPYGGAYEIYTAMHNEAPDFMVWLGDNVYLREPDWNSRTGILRRYTHTRSLPQMQPFLGSVHHYAIWDDHDAGPNNTNSSFWNLPATHEAFELFWANPSYGQQGNKGAYTFFNWNDADFFLLDNRTFRDPNHLQADNKTILGKQQLQWFLNALLTSNARVKFVALGGQFLNNSGQYETYTNYGFEQERQAIIEFIYRHEIENVIFLTGDRHHSEFSLLKADDKPTIYDVTVSPLNSGAHKHPEEPNDYRVKNSYVGVRNYGLFRVHGPKEARRVTFYFKDSKGKPLYENHIVLQ